MRLGGLFWFFVVSTHSRLKAAGICILAAVRLLDGFNTQPPEGGWFFEFLGVAGRHSFNTQPPEGGWVFTINITAHLYDVSTHSRLKAAGD